MPNIGVPELLVILLVALVVFGPRKLPELGKSLGAGLREFRKSTQGLKEEFEGTLRDPATPPGPAPVQTIHVAAAPGTVTPATPPAEPAPVNAEPAPVSAAAMTATPAPTRTDPS
ncbi:twin-arginine translocase TatA/TatE family subunit [Deinococcus taeanensis]|uniref:twin-arginine translocase TatA/TatE family subunit n=1 Tax=Deinococcus taeanensis TaxID=2737050 RepID=UPI002559FF8F|nr:twin-arginine translocase TatA/TatE family subunit [Deinococcus taeanensis]